MTDNLLQCTTCRLKGTRACTYHGYPDTDIPKSCSYKLGNNAEEALRNLNGTFIDVWTPEHDEQVKRDVLNKVFSSMDTFFGKIPMDANIIKWAVSKQDSFVTAAMASYLESRTIRGQEQRQ